MVWLTGLAMAMCLLMIVALLALTIVQGSRTFWQSKIERVQLRDGTVLMGMSVRSETFDPGADVRDALQKRLAAGELQRSMFGESTDGNPGLPLRTLYRVGNKEFRAQPYEWVPAYEVARVDRDPAAVLLERREWGIWIGTPEAVVKQRTVTVDAAAEIEPVGKDEQGRVVRRLPGGDPSDGKKTVVERTVLAQGPELAQQIARLHDEATERYERIERLKRHDVGEINRKLEAARIEYRTLEIQHARSRGQAGGMPLVIWIGVVVLAAAALAGAVVSSNALAKMSRTPGRITLGRRAVCATLWILGAALLIPVIVERPWSGDRISDEALAAGRATFESRQADLNAEYESVLQRIRTLDAEDAAYRVIVREATNGRFAPLRQTLPDEPMRLSQVVRWVRPNDLSFAGKVGVYIDRWREFLLDDPREANTEGGIFPVIFGTVALTLLLSVVVVPLGVIAALYMREYAKQGFLISVVRIAVNNLAGVPSIVYGVFGLGFFCYSLGTFIDKGPAPEAVVSRGPWWISMGSVAVVTIAAAWISLAARPKPGQAATGRQRWLGIAGVIAWIASAIGCIALITGTPYFHGFFEAHPSATFGTRGMLWGALTLALLTLPVVIVATEEAIAAVPRTMREGSYGCGASKWQTIRRIVLPRAMPGIMTGMILAMARGAGEVAPLMLVGAVKLAPELPISGHWPFIHLERSFMHLGFHIYDVGFQSPDSEAARPLVWTTTLVLVLIVLLLNLAAIRIRANLRRKFTGGAF